MVEREELMANGDFRFIMDTLCDYGVVFVRIPTSKHGFERLASPEFKVTQEGSPSSGDGVKAGLLGLLVLFGFLSLV